VLAVLVALAPLVLVAAYYADQFGLTLGEIPWSALLLVVGGAVALPTVLAWCLRLGLLASTLSILHARAPHRPGADAPRPRRPLARLGTEQRRLAFLARALRRKAQPGDALGRLRIGKIGSSFVVVQGTDGSSLQKGPGHYPDTPLPGLGGTVAVAGHRTTYLAPFRHIDDVRRGNLIDVQMPYGRFTYAVERTRIVSPSEYSVIRPVGYDRLVLTACHPLY